jgi:hypothetical protein
VSQPVHNRPVGPAGLFPLVSVHGGRSRDDGSRRGRPKRPAGRLAVAAGMVGLLALVAVGGGLVARWSSSPAPAAVTQHVPEAPAAAPASSPELPSPDVDGTIPPAPTLLATTEPVTRSVIPAASAPASKARTQRRTRARRIAGEPGAPPVFTGTLAVESNPAGGAVFLDRQRVGTTPLRLTGVTAGAHVIWIESRGHARWTASVQVNTGKVVRVRATLQPQP